MISALASFTFINSQFELIEEAKSDIYVKLDRHLIHSNRTVQGVVVGAIKGYETRLQVLNQGQPDNSLIWELSTNKKVLATNTALNNIIPLPMDYGDHNKYQLKIYPTLTESILEQPIKISKKINKSTANQVIISSINQLLVAKLNKFLTGYNIQYGSAHQDNSGNNDKYLNSVRVEAKDKPLYHLFVYHTDQYYIDMMAFYGPKRPINIKTIVWDISFPDLDSLFNEIILTVTADDTYVDTLRSSPVASL